ncbi:MULTISPECIES: amino acid ABC transporter permease [Marinobacter]|uniref:Amino acid ABC transporter permease n=1 Tax=Marinobacter suaedae TaxID=3057675 RepID=A0ABT8W327_9GAMM|nr:MULTISPECIES: amino acid ABC transporter permease [unclassified Marinobacter]MBZ2167623.1 amino acid ABC transporter permease [Marinobacter sp. F4216]MDO3722643.1 amino acid ABC transporter permease [Marinobacter sp. chi1]
MNSLFTPLSWDDTGYILTGVWNTITISVVAIVAGTLLGMIVGFARAESNKTVNFLFGSVLDILRSVPLIIQLILFSTFVGAIGHPMNPFVAGSIVLSLYTMAFMSEVFRGGFESVSKSMQTAARSLGMTYWQTIYHIRFPIGLRAVLPSWMGVALSVIKDSALVSVIGYMELLRTSEQLISRTQQPLEILIGVGLFYFIISYPLSHYGRYLERKMAI